MPAQKAWGQDKRGLDDTLPRPPSGLPTWPAALGSKCFYLTACFLLQTLCSTEPHKTSFSDLRFLTGLSYKGPGAISKSWPPQVDMPNTYLLPIGGSQERLLPILPDYPIYSMQDS